MLNSKAFFSRFYLLLMVISLTVIGCGSQNEPDDLSYVLLMGVDHGAENNLRVSHLIAIPKGIAGGQDEGGGGAGDAQKGAFVTAVETPSIYASMNMVNTFVGRRLTLMHTKGIIFSEAMAKDGSMAKFVAALIQSRETRGTAFVAVSKEKPEVILENLKPRIDSNPSKYIELLAATSSFTGFVPNTQLQKFYNEMKVEGVSPVAFLLAKSDEKLPPETGQNSYRTGGSYIAGQLNKKGGVALEAMGSAAFQGGKMVGELDGDETTLYSMFRGEFGRGIFSFQDPLLPGGIISMDVNQSRKPKIKVMVAEEGAVVEVDISLEGNILGNTSLIDYGLPENRAVLEKAFAKMLEADAAALVNRTQQEFKADILGIGLKARHLALNQKEWEELNWESLYQTADIKVKVDYRIRRTGTLLRLMPIADPKKNVREGDNPR